MRVDRGWPALTDALMTGHMESELIHVRSGDQGHRRRPDHPMRSQFAHTGRGDGLLHVFVPHATAGVAIIETGAGSDEDLLAALDELLPADDRWRHRHGSPGTADRT